MKTTIETEPTISIFFQDRRLSVTHTGNEAVKRVLALAITISGV